MIVEDTKLCISSHDCPEGTICACNECEPVGPGLLSHLDDGNIIEYNPVQETIELVEPELTEEEIERCERLGREFGYDEKAIENIKNTTRQLKGLQVVKKNSLDELAKMIEQVWDRSRPEREITLYVTQEGFELFDQAVKKEFEKLN